jgi:hypothetical protein
VVETWVALDRFSPWKLTSRLRPPPVGGSSPSPPGASSFGLKLFIDAHASISVPSTVK